MSAVGLRCECPPSESRDGVTGRSSTRSISREVLAAVARRPEYRLGEERCDIDALVIDEAPMSLGALASGSVVEAVIELDRCGPATCAVRNVAVRAQERCQVWIDLHHLSCIEDLSVRDEVKQFGRCRSSRNGEERQLDRWT